MNFALSNIFVSLGVFEDTIKQRNCKRNAKFFHFLFGSLKYCITFAQELQTNCNRQQKLFIIKNYLL